jgi:hypothetical protein
LAALVSPELAGNIGQVIDEHGEICHGSSLADLAAMTLEPRYRNVRSLA